MLRPSYRLRFWLILVLLVSFFPTLPVLSQTGTGGNSIYLPMIISGPMVGNPPTPLHFKIAAGGWHTCALTQSGQVKCWGGNYAGQLGDGTKTDHWTAVGVVGLSSGVSVIATGFAHTCALTQAGGVKCWGDNTWGQLGDGTNIDSMTPVDVVGLTSGVNAIAAGAMHTCALTQTGGVKCWGGNSDGELGDGTISDHLTPIDVIGLNSGVSAIAAGAFHSCALTQSGGVMCWGLNSDGQVGDGTNTDHRSPVSVVGLTSGASAITAGAAHTCALTQGGGVKCWGWNEYGQLGDGTYTAHPSPVNVVGLTSGVSVIASGADHVCALTAGAVKCWGWNNQGGLGDGTYTDHPTPINVIGLTSGVSAIGTGAFHTCALTQAGGVKCWGNNHYGGLGDGTNIDRLTPKDVIGFP